MTEFGPRSSSIRSTPPDSTLAKSKPPPGAATSFTFTPSIRTSNCSEDAPRTRTPVNEPAGPLRLIAVPGRRRSTRDEVGALDGLDLGQFDDGHRLAGIVERKFEAGRGDGDRDRPRPARRQGRRRRSRMWRGPMWQDRKSGRMYPPDKNECRSCRKTRARAYPMPSVHPARWLERPLRAGLLTSGSRVSPAFPVPCGTSDTK